jgi:hypothetical protein
MIMESKHLMNVAKDGRHFCRIDLGTGLRNHVVILFKDIRARFPASEGFECTLTYWDCVGRSINPDAN